MPARVRIPTLAAALLAPLLLFPLMSRPTLAFGVVALAVFIGLAWHSVAWPVALTGLPTVFVALLGHNPFPTGAVSMAFFGWTILALAIAAARGSVALSYRALANLPVVASVLLAVLLVVRLGASPAYAYGSVKTQLFVAGNVFGVIPAILIGASSRHFRIFLGGLAAVTVLTALVLVDRLVSGSTQTSVGGRFSLDAFESPIALGRSAAVGIILCIYFAVAGKSPLSRLIGLGSLPVIAVAFVASGSRGPVLGLVVALVVFLVMTLRDRSARVRVLFVALAAIFAGILVTQLVPGHDVQRSLSVITGSGGGLSSNGRTQLWHTASSLFAGHPLLGIGTGGFAAADPNGVYPHNLFLELGAEVGVLGILAAALIVSGSLRALWCAGRFGRDSIRAEVALVAALFTAALVNAQVSGDVTTNSGLWVAAGLAVGLAGRSGFGVVALPAFRISVRSSRPRRERSSSTRAGIRPPKPSESKERQRFPGQIDVPAEGAVVSGLVEIAGRAARTGWGVTGVRLEVARDGGDWNPVEASSRGLEIKRIINGAEHTVAVARTEHVAKVLVSALRNGVNAEYRLEPVREGHFRGDTWSLEWDASAVSEGEYRLRAVTTDIAGLQVATPPRRITVSAAARPSASPAGTAPVEDVRRPAPPAAPTASPTTRTGARAQERPSSPVARPRSAPAPARAAATGPSADQPPHESTLILLRLERLVAERPDPNPYVQVEREAMVRALREQVDPAIGLKRELEILAFDLLEQIRERDSCNGK